MAKLSVHDRAVLSCIFNPSLPLDAIVEAEDVNMHLRDDDEESYQEIEKIKVMECKAIHLAESGKTDEAIKILEEAIHLAPQKASLYNNRAQVYQLKRKPNDALDDLTKAIELSGDKLLRTKREALCQRGLLYRKMENEELARNDFNEASKLGSQFAKNQLIEMNPYAALCNQMLKQAVENLQK
ncbi:tetratricopeptide repeat protein 36 homolog [Agrilus planipennis]|uniref:Tetratricopeptide repeat protein 36 homolog n=1 Tax=Agrilus planipennis TaxID=224129 RepID=A0A1W4XA58_AGRPL|nr:tetratricopeptide repeat protein 36 homolog [Agrilus planipennis]